MSAGLLTHWGRETHICVSKISIIGSDNGLSPGRRQAIIWTKAGILSIGSIGTSFNEILIEIQTFSFTKMHLKMSSAKWRPFCLGLNVLTGCSWRHTIACFENFVGIYFTRCELICKLSYWPILRILSRSCWCSWRLSVPDHQQPWYSVCPCV